MKIVLQDIVPPIAERSENFKKIIFMNGESFYPHDIPQNDFHEFALHALQQNNLPQNNWKQVIQKTSTNNSSLKKIILEHVTRSRNILCITSDAQTILHHSSFTLNKDLEIIPITSSMRAKYIQEIKKYSSVGNSVIGIAIKKIESKSSTTADYQNGIFIALALYPYSLTSHARTTIDNYFSSNKSLKIFSKELLPVCKWFARNVGIHASNDFCITSDELQSMHDSELLSVLKHATVFAEMTPLDLQRVSRLLAQQGHELIN